MNVAVQTNVNVGPKQIAERYARTVAEIVRRYSGTKKKEAARGRGAIELLPSKETLGGAYL